MAWAAHQAPAPSGTDLPQRAACAVLTMTEKEHRRADIALVAVVVLYVLAHLLGWMD